MIYKIFQPTSRVGEFVKWYHLLHFNFKHSEVSPFKSYFPHAEQCLTFDPRGRVRGINTESGHSEKRGFSYLSAQQTSTYDLRFDEDYLMLKVVFKPGALFRLFGIPLTEFGDRYVDAELVIPGEVRQVNEQLAHGLSYQQMIVVVDQYLQSKIETVKVPKEPIDRVLDLFRPDCIYPVDRLASDACLSVRQLERKYLERIGVSPVVYNRICRFNNAFAMKEKNSSKSWFAIAIDCGYTDLQHLIKDFKQFSGNRPSQLLYEESRSLHRQFNLA